MTDASLRYVGEMRKLEKLTLEAPHRYPNQQEPGVTDIGIGYLANLRSLHELELSRFVLRGDALGGLRALRKLSLSQCEFSTEADSSMAKCTQLEEFQYVCR